MKLLTLAVYFSLSSTAAFGIGLPEEVKTLCSEYKIPADLLKLGQDHQVIRKKDIKVLGYYFETFDVEIETSRYPLNHGLSAPEIAHLFNQDACYPAYVWSWSCDKPTSSEFGEIAGGLCYDHFQPLFKADGEGQEKARNGN